MSTMELSVAELEARVIYWFHMVETTWSAYKRYRTILFDSRCASQLADLNWDTCKIFLGFLAGYEEWADCNTQPANRRERVEIDTDTLSEADAYDWVIHLMWRYNTADAYLEHTWPGTQEEASE